MKHCKTIFLLVLIGLSTSVNALDFVINENTKISEIRNALGSSVRSLLYEKQDADFLDSGKYTFLDAYSNTFGVVVSGVYPVSYHLSNKLADKNTNQLLKLRLNESQSADVSILGVKLGANFNQAQQQIQALSTFNKAVTAQNGNGIEYQLSDGARVVVRSDASNNVSDVELFLN
jgi:hypothetical protein